jgi:hypothetical protein
MSQLWEILVPCQYNTGKPVRTRHHRCFDAYVEKISGGLTILKPTKGKWTHAGTKYEERVIPVRIVCTRNEIDKIMGFALKHYKQIAIMAYLISNEVLIQYEEKATQ